jgi:hypothetical protein
MFKMRRRSLGELDVLVTSSSYHLLGEPGDGIPGLFLCRI